MTYRQLLAQIGEMLARRLHNGSAVRMLLRLGIMDHLQEVMPATAAAAAVAARFPGALLLVAAACCHLGAW
jgi:hypothetical protein